MTWPGALMHAARDPELRGAPLAVYVHLLFELDTQSYRAVKVESIACELRIKYATAAWAMHRLSDRGYIERGPTVERLRTYRLVWSVRQKSA